MASKHSKLLNTLALALIALCSVISKSPPLSPAPSDRKSDSPPAFGSLSQECDQLGSCRRYFGATIAFFALSCIVALALLALWFVRGEVAEKAAVPAAAFLFGWTGVGLALQQQATSVRFSMAHVCVAAACLLLVYNLNKADFKVKVVKKAKPGDTAAAEGPTVVTEEPNV